jgi:hypothetical protein
MYLLFSHSLYLSPPIEIPVGERRERFRNNTPIRYGVMRLGFGGNDQDRPNFAGGGETIGCDAV